MDDRQQLFILTGGSSSAKPSNFEFYLSLSDLVYGLEAIDVRNGEYDCFTSRGDAINLVIMPDAEHPGTIELATVKAEISPAPHRGSEYKNIIISILKDLRCGEWVAFEDELLQEMTLSELCSLIPERLVERGASV